MRAFCLCACEGGISTKPPEKDELEAKIANDVRSYLSICGRGDSSEEEQLRAVCSGLAWLLAELLQKSDKWSSYHWVDAISPASTEIISTGELNIQGLMIWGDRGHTQEWWEPFSATLRVAEAIGGMLRYRLMLGDAAWGLGKVPYNCHPKGWNWASPKQWLFVFSG